MPSQHITPVWRMDLPDDWSPAGFWCVQIVIPGDPQYMTALGGALGALTLSKTWFKDPTGAGPETVAETWENALYMTPFTVQEGCIVIPPPPIPDEAAAADWSAAIIQLFAEHVIGELNTCAPGPSYCAGCVASLMTELAPYGAGDAVQGMLAKLCQDLTGLSGSARAAYATDCPFIPEFNALRDHISANPFDWLNNLSDWLFGWLNSTADTIMQDLNITAALLGGGALGQWVNDHGGAGGGSSFGGSCPWTAHFDFTVTDGGWIPVPESGSNDPEAQWLTGTGWSLAIAHDTGGDNYNGKCSIRLTTDPFTILSITGNGSLHVGTDTGHSAPFEQAYNGAANTDYALEGDGITWSNTDAHSGSVLIQLYMIASTEHGSPPADPGSAVITSCDVVGTGTIPAQLAAYIV